MRMMVVHIFPSLSGKSGYFSFGSPAPYSWLVVILLTFQWAVCSLASWEEKLFLEVPCICPLCKRIEGALMVRTVDVWMVMKRFWKSFHVFYYETIQWFRQCLVLAIYILRSEKVTERSNLPWPLKRWPHRKKYCYQICFGHSTL